MNAWAYIHIVSQIQFMLALYYYGPQESSGFKSESNFSASDKF